MTQREKTLTGLVAAAGVLWFGSSGLEKYQAAVERNESQQLSAEKELAEAKQAVLRGQRARRQLRKWRGQSLPANRELAKSLYQDWLREQLTSAGLNVTQLADKSAGARRGDQSELSVDVTAEGQLGQLADFLYKFYSAVHLHRISSATLTAADNGQKVTAELTIDALLLPESRQTDKLAEGEPLPLPLPQEEFKTRIVSRNLFSPPKTKVSGDKSDAAAAGAQLTGSTYDSRGWVLVIRTADGQAKKFYIGDEVEFGQFKGKLAELDRRRAVFETDKGTMEVRLGQKLSEAVVVESPAA